MENKREILSSFYITFLYILQNLEFSDRYISSRGAYVVKINYENLESIDVLKLVPFLVHQDESHCGEGCENQDDRDNHEVQEVFIMCFLSVQEKKSQNSIRCQFLFEILILLELKVMKIMVNLRST